MKRIANIGLKDVQAVYGGPEKDLWELVMGEQIHIGGFASSMALAQKAKIGPGMRGVDLCCCTGAGMRFLVKLRDVASMHGVDATEKVVETGRRRCVEQGFGDKIAFSVADVCATGLPARSFDFVWGEDAWCYVVDKDTLIAEAARVVKPGGTLAFTDWVEGSKGLTDAEAARYLAFMKFANVLSLADYRAMLETHGFQVEIAEDTGGFAPAVDLYITMLTQQLTYDALRIIGFDTALMQALGGEMEFMRQLAHAGKIAQGRFVAKKTR
jgi:ubiquinone/menaquinone biosynthesis C-methylase UbiE